MDGGAQSPLGIGVKGRHDLLQPLTFLVEPLQALGANRLIPDGEVGSDDEPFIVLGIPAIELNTEPGDYDTNQYESSRHHRHPGQGRSASACGRYGRDSASCAGYR